MPLYEYECPKCKAQNEVAKMISNIDDIEACLKCGTAMERVILNGRNFSARTCQFEAHFNYGLGKEVHTKRQLDETIKRISGETGKEIVEVGNDNLQSIKKQRKKYDENIRLGDFT